MMRRPKELNNFIGRLFYLALLLSLVLAPSIADTKEQSPKTETVLIESDGYGYFSLDKTGEQLKQEAIAQAKRNALESAWTKIQSLTQVKDGQVVVDLIETKAEGAIKVLELKDHGLKENRYHIHIRAEVKYALNPSVEREAKKAPLSMEVGFYFEGKDGKPYPLRQGMVLYPHDNYAIYFKPDEECFVHIYQVDSTGRVYCLFPNKEYHPGDNAVIKDKAYWVPTKPELSSRPWFYLDENVGKEWLYLIASKHKTMDFTKGKKELAEEDFKNAIKTMGVGGIRRSQVEIKKLPTGDESNVLSDQVESLQEDMVYKVWFWHR